MQKPFTGFGEGNVSCRSRHQPNTKTLLKKPHSVADGRWRHTQLSGSLGEALFAGYRQEDLDIVDIALGHL
jgi:hypothetical protein